MVGYCPSFVIVVPLVEDTAECEGRGVDFKFIWFGWIWVPEDRFGGYSCDEFI
jgi:hypothetical protein